MKKILEQLIQHQPLSQEQAYVAMKTIGEGTVPPAQMATFMASYLMRGISISEVKGFREALLDMCIKIDLNDFDTIDIVGTGGDGKNTFNISTLSCFVVAGTGIKVAKHGNYGVSSNCGSSNVLESLGYVFTNDVSKIKKQIDVAGFSMLHAPLFHPALKHVAPVRRELGMKTIFNLLGPLVNPSLPKYHALGTYNIDLQRLYAYVHQQLNTKYSIVHAMDGYDEVSLTGTFKLFTNQVERIYQPKDLNMPILTEIELSGGETVEDSAKIFMNVLSNNCTNAQKNVVIANAAVALNCVHQSKTLLECADIAKESLESGKAMNVFKKAIELSK
jgi:anthranilate phosphoribosyltransferase